MLKRDVIEELKKKGFKARYQNVTCLVNLNRDYSGGYLSSGRGKLIYFIVKRGEVIVVDCYDKVLEACGW